jgi:Putative auto-transporter adhesin, head GIN domain
MIRSLCVASCLIIALGCDSSTTIVPGGTITQVRIANGYHSVVVANGIRVEYDDAITDSLQITIQEGFLPYFRMDVEDSVLSLYMDDAVDLEEWSPATVRIAGVPIRRIVLSGGSIWVANRRMTEKNLSCNLSGGSILQGSVAPEQLVAELSGGSTVMVTGTADVVAFGPVSGGSRVNAFAIDARMMSIEASGGSRLDVNVRDSLTVNASGGSTIRYVGSPIVLQALTGGSTVIKQ